MIVEGSQGLLTIGEQVDMAQFSTDATAPTKGVVKREATYEEYLAEIQQTPQWPAIAQHYTEPPADYLRWYEVAAD